MATHPAHESTSSAAAASGDPIVVEAVVKQFGALRALDGVSLSVASGETFGLIGPNGSGKTTLIRLLLGLGRAASGSVRVLGRVMPDRRVANDDIVTLVDLGDRVGSPVQTLSGGMRQRVSLACALIHQPRLLVLDEPTVGIDPELRHAFWDYFARLNQQGVTIVVSTHHLDEAAHCHRIALLRYGRLLAVDTPDALRRQSGEDDFERAFLYFAQRQEDARATA